VEATLYDNMDALESLAKYWEDLLRFSNCESRNENDANNWNILWRSLICNRTYTGKYPAPPIYSEYAIEWIADTLSAYAERIIKEGQRSQSSDGADTSTILQGNQSSNSVEDVSRCDYSRFQRLYSLLQRKTSCSKEQEELHHVTRTNQYGSARVLEHRRVFKAGCDLFGVGPADLQEGDQVWIICNANVPILLRPTSNRSEFNIIGYCYMHNFMHGEMLGDYWGLKDRIVRIDIV
jgi:hypothetical protein